MEGRVMWFEHVSIIYGACLQTIDEGKSKLPQSGSVVFLPSGAQDVQGWPWQRGARNHLIAGEGCALQTIFGEAKIGSSSGSERFFR